MKKFSRFFSHGDQNQLGTGMATIGIGVGVTKLQPHKPKSKSLFLGQRLRIRPFWGEPQCSERRLFGVSNPPRVVQVFALGGGEWLDTVHNLFVGVGVGLPCSVMQCGDVIYRSTLPKSNGLTLTVPGVILALGTLSYLWATPGVAPGFFDMFVLAFVERLFRPTYKKACEFKLKFLNFYMILFFRFVVIEHRWYQGVYNKSRCSTIFIQYCL